MVSLPSTVVTAPDCQQNWEKLRSVLMPAVVTSLPTADLFDGREVYYVADSTNGVVWHLKYRKGSSSTYKWEFVGGGWLVEEAGGSVSTTSASYTTLANGPDFALPLAGDYEFEWGHGGLVYSASAGFGGTAVSRPHYNGTQVGGFEARTYTHGNAPNDGGLYSDTMKASKFTATTAGQTLELRYLLTLVGGGTGTAAFVRRFLRARPVRVA